MHRKNTLFAKCASGILSFSLIMSMIPAVPAWAEEDSFDEEYAEEATWDTEPEDSSSIFYITGFTKFEKDSEGHFTDDETKSKYGDLKASPGTSLKDLGLPKTLELDGYWEADGPNISSVLTLEDVDWTLKSDTEEYSEVSPEGTYTFIPDYTAYVARDESLDDIFLAEGVKDLTIDVQIVTEKETETESEAVTEAESTAPATAETDAVSEPATEPVIPDATDDSTSSDSSENPTSDINIFEDLDETVIDANAQEEYKGSDDFSDVSGTEADGTVLIPEQDTSEVQTEAVTEAQTEAQSEATSELQSESVSEAQSEVTSEAASEIQTEAVTEAQTDAPATLPAPENGEATQPVAVAQTLTGTLVFRNAGDDTVIKEYPDDGSSTISFTADTTTQLSSLQLPCSASLSSLSIQFVLSDQTAYNLSTADFSDGSTRHLSFTDGTNTYYLDLALTKADHSFTQATCQQPATCVNCGITTGDLADHVSANNATCTTDATCSVCGQPIAGTALGHDWVPATCTTPKTCSRCNATEGTALGHDLQDDWETMEASTYSSHGYQERYCHRDNCDYSETRDLNIIGDPTDNSIQNLTEGATYDINTRLTFSAYGAATENTSPINKDVRYIPSTWSIQGMAGTWLDNFSGAFSISKTGTYTVTVTFQKQVYGDGSWQNTDIADSKTVTFSVGGASTDGSNDAVRINPQTGDQTPILPFVIVLVVAAAVIIVVLVMRKKKQN